MEKTDSEIYREYLDRLHLYFDPLIVLSVRRRRQQTRNKNKKK
jgi:hypothetical protein